MVLGSCYSYQGKSHKINNTVCQDASVVKDIAGDWVVMAIADGVGSCKKSDVGAKTAVEAASQLCVDSFPFDGNDDAILSLIRTAFNCAFNEITKIAQTDKEDIADYDTTLDVVIFNGTNKLYYGHCGDGGIFILSGQGYYSEITTVQEGEDASSVKPLRCGNNSWEFGIVENDIAIVAAFTDGIRDKLSPNLLKKEKYTIDVPLANTFMFIDVFGLTEEESFAVMEESMKRSAVYLHSKECPITDDITMAILINTSVPIDIDPIENYEFPDWISIWKDMIERHYPDHKAVGEHDRRHILLRHIMTNPDKVALDNVDYESMLDNYYPLTDDEQILYKEKYLTNRNVSEPQDVQKKTHLSNKKKSQDDKNKKSVISAGLHGALECFEMVGTALSGLKGVEKNVSDSKQKKEVEESKDAAADDFLVDHFNDLASLCIEKSNPQTLLIDDEQSTNSFLDDVGSDESSCITNTEDLVSDDESDDNSD